MSEPSSKKPLWAAAGTAVLILVVAAFVWNEARKEVVFLCGNFQPGVSEDSVLAQLETGHFLRYRFEDAVQGRRIVVASPYNFSVYSCVIDIGRDGQVLASGVE